MRALLAALVLLAGWPAVASATTVDFDDLPPGTVVTNQYASAGGPGQGVVFGPLPGGAGDGLRPIIEAPGGAQPNSLPHVASLANCFACEFYVPNTTGTFQTARTRVEVKVGYTGAFAPPCPDGSTEVGCAVLTLTAYNSAGMPVGAPDSATVRRGAGVKTSLEVINSSATIVGFRITARESHDVSKSVAIDDLTFETDPGTPPPDPDFSLAVAEGNVVMRQGQTVTDAISIGRFGGSSGDVDLEVSGLPAGVTATLDPDPAPGDGSTLSLTAAPDAPPTDATPATVVVTGTPASAATGSETRTTSLTLQVRTAFDVRLRGPAKVALDPCEARVEIAVSRDFSLPGPVAMSVTGGGRGITGALDKSQATFAGGAGGEIVTLTATGPPTGQAAGPATFTVTGRVPGLPDRSVAVTVSGVCPAGYDARVTSMLVTQGTQTPFVQTRTPENPKGEFSYSNLPGTAELRAGAPTVVRVYANLAAGPPEGVARVPAVLYGSRRDRNGTPVALPGSPLLPVSGVRRLEVGPDAPSVAEQSSETAVYSFVLPDEWTRGTVSLGSAVQPALPPPRPIGVLAQGLGERAVTPCDTEACRVNDSMTIRGIPYASVRHVSIRPLAMEVNGAPMPPVEDVFSWLRRVTPVNLSIEPYAATLDISGLAASSKTGNEKNTAAADRVGDWLCDHSTPSRGWVVGVNTGVARGLKRGGHWCWSKLESFSLAVVDYQRPITSVGHEVHHLFGRVHAARACGAEDTSNGKVEDWPPDERGLTQSVGLDVLQGSGRNGGPFAVMSPPLGPPTNSREWFELMSYCASPASRTDFLNGPRDLDAWISVRNWNRIIDGQAFRSAPVSVAQARPLAPALRVTAFAGTSETTIETVAPVDSPPPPRSQSPYRLVGLDAAGAVVADVPMQEGELHVDGEAAPLPLDGVIPAGRVVTVAVVRDGATLASRSRSATAPTASVAVPRFSRDRAILRWTQADADGDELRTEIAYARDGRTFKRIWAGAGPTRTTVPARYLSRSPRGRLRVTVNDGFRATSATSKAFRSPGARPEVRIISPLAGAAQPVDAALVLRGEAFDDRGRPITGRRLVWRAGRRVLGRGESTSALGLPPGARRIVLVARDAAGRKGRASVRLRMKGASPILLQLKAPKAISRKARRLTLKVAASLPSRLTVRGQRFKVGRKARNVRVRVPRGRKALKLKATLNAGGRRSVTPLVVKRR